MTNTEMEHRERTEVKKSQCQAERGRRHFFYIETFIKRQVKFLILKKKGNKNYMIQESQKVMGHEVLPHGYISRKQFLGQKATAP